jgi:hypothetical protein
MNRKGDRRAAGQEAPMVITPTMVTQLIRQIITGLHGVAKKARQR